MGKSDKISTYDTIAWVDTETTGLRPESANVIELAIVITDQDCNILDSYETKLKLSNAAKAAARVVDSDTAKALAVNGYNEAEWADAVESDRTVWQKVYRMTEKRTFGGQNTPFDAGFLTAEMNRFGIRPRWVRRLLDTTSYAIIVMNDLGITDPKTGFPSANLQLVYEALGGPEVPAHRAMGDVQRCIYLYKYFREGYFRVKRARAFMADAKSRYAEGALVIPSGEPLAIENHNSDGTVDKIEVVRQVPVTIHEESGRQFFTPGPATVAFLAEGASQSEPVQTPFKDGFLTSVEHAKVPGEFTEKSLTETLKETTLLSCVDEFEDTRKPSV